MFLDVVAQFAALAGFSALIAVVVNILKIFNLVKEDQAPLWVGGANLICILVMYGLRIFKPEFDFTTLNPIAAEAATVATFILAYVSQLLVSKVTHFAVKGIPMVGKSFSYDKALALRKQALK